MKEGFLNILYLAVIASWITSIVTCIKTASWALLFAVIFFPPIGLIHGVAVWFGVL